MVVDSGADVVVTTSAGLDVIAGSAMVVVGVAVEVGEAAVEETAVAASVVVDSGAAGATTSVVETISLVTVPSPTGSSLNSVSPEVPAPCGCRGWHADKTTTQANEAIATFRNSVCGIPNVRTWRCDSPLRLSKVATIVWGRCVTPDPGSNRMRLQADALFRDAAFVR